VDGRICGLAYNSNHVRSHVATVYSLARLMSNAWLSSMAFFSFALHSACVLPSTFLMMRFPVSGWYPELAEQVERAHEELRRDMDAAGHRRLLRLLDAQNALLAESKLMSFTAGFKLAWGMAKELEEDGFYSFEWEEEEHICRPAEQVDA
jgi:hypothetical protein